MHGFQMSGIKIHRVLINEEYEYFSYAYPLLRTSTVSIYMCLGLSLIMSGGLLFLFFFLLRYFRGFDPSDDGFFGGDVISYRAFRSFTVWEACKAFIFLVLFVSICN